MPSGMPTPEQLYNGETCFFSLDTDVIQAEGYNFETGALNQLPRQLPSAMSLLLTSVVAEEIIRHRMESVTKYIAQLTAASDHLKRLTLLPMADIDNAFSVLNAESAGRDHFRQQIQAYATACRGLILPIEGADLSRKMFELYFAAQPPFGLRVEKKSEFPDAASLLLLESHVADYDSKGIVVSMDGGWRAFCDQSEHLYCAQSLDELTALFAATGEVATDIQNQINTAVADNQSFLRSLLNSALDEHVNNARWEVGEIFSDNGQRVEGEVYDYNVSDYDLDADHTSLWNDENDPSVWVIEVVARVMVNVLTSVTIYQWDWIDKEEIAMEGESVESEAEIEVTAFFTCSNVRAGSTPEFWDVEVEIAPGEYAVPIGEVSAYADDD